MMEELGENPNAVGFAQRFSDIIDLLFIDKSDNHLDKEIKSIIKKTFFTNILMKDQNDKLNLSKKILEVSQEIIK